MKYLLVFCLTILICCIYLFVSKFTLIRVNGFSMHPTLKHGQFYLMNRDVIDFELNHIYVIDSPTGVPAIKRLKDIKNNDGEILLWFEGDNKKDSIDSRNFGYLYGANVIGKVITKK